ncbi:hypothetical protein BBJ29_005954 [Phytophthora kernoviae]|uniref:CDC48 domain-containing protein n=1 Tax=Phytophthora kernoviae TaxID=325452 RepID=A0A3F2RGV8_9STRA|nr:hypothetical protein BBP00_00007922 [Phytophthora kernoviae]RLN60613.1 hypothetical protein BBJ29_005954 [Phytophthora kernoviae]
MLIGVDEVSTLLHQHGALAFWDYDVRAPYVDIDIEMNPKNPMTSKDAIFFSGHKFIGGPRSINVIVVKMTLTTNDEGDTLDILGSIRLNLVFELKQCGDPKRIMELADNTNTTSERHWVATKAFDLCGVQVDCGCLYASPSSRRLLELTQEDIIALDQAIVVGNEIFESSGTRISFPYFVEDAEIDYILEALHFLADHGWKFLPKYNISCCTGVWRHVSRATENASLTSMKALGVTHGDVVLLAQGGRKTVAIARLDESDDAHPRTARISTIMRRNLHVDLDGEVTLTNLGNDVPDAKFIRVLPIDDTVDDCMLGEKLFDRYLQPYFTDAFRPIQQGDLLLVRHVAGGPDVEFVVVETDPKPYCIVGPNTDIFYNGTPASRHDLL